MIESWINQEATKIKYDIQSWLSIGWNLEASQKWTSVRIQEGFSRFGELMWEEPS